MALAARVAAGLTRSVAAGQRRQRLLLPLRENGRAAVARGAAGGRRGFSGKPEFGSDGQGRAPITWVSLGALVATGGAALWYYDREKQRMLQRAKQKHSRVIGKPLLGGPWTLVDHNGRPVTDATLLEDGHTHSLLYFGFTFCPDICPAELIKMKEIIDKLDADPEVGPVVRPVFISVDPKRDGVAQVRHYVRDFHPRMLGLTGTPGQVADACKAYRVYHSVADQDRENEDDYLVDHSIVMYLIGPDGVFIDFFTQLTEAPEAVERIKARILDPPVYE